MRVCLLVTMCLRAYTMYVFDVGIFFLQRRVSLCVPFLGALS